MTFTATKIENKKNAWLVTDKRTGEKATVYCSLSNNTEDAAIETLKESLGPPKPPSVEKLASYARDERNALLADSDWTQVPDAPVDQAAWATYRQALRDVPEQAGFPEEVTWPEKP